MPDPRDTSQARDWIAGIVAANTVCCQAVTDADLAAGIEQCWARIERAQPGTNLYHAAAEKKLLMAYQRWRRALAAYEAASARADQGKAWWG